MSSNVYRICTVTPGGFVRLDPPVISPETACKRDPEEFLRFAKEVVLVAQKEMAKRAQLNMALWGEEKVYDIAAG